MFRLLLRAGGIQDRLLGVGYESVVWLFLPMLGTDTSPLSRAPVFPILPAPYRAKGVDWAFEIRIRPVGDWFPQGRLAMIRWLA